MTPPVRSDDLTDGRAPSSYRASVWAEDLRGLTVGLLLTVTLAAFEALAVATAMPVVARDLGMIELYGWVFSAFMLGNLVGVVVAGLLVDRHGLLAPYVFGLGLFTLGLVVGGLAPSMPVLILARAVQGAGAGAIPATAYVAVRREYPSRLRPLMFAYFSTAWVVPGLVGPAIAGLVAEHISWRAVFLGLLPLVVPAALLTIPSLRVLAYDDADAGEPAHGSAGELESARPGLRRVLLAIRVAAGAALVLAALDTRNPPLAAVLAAAGLVAGIPALTQLVPPGTLRLHRGVPAAILLRGVLTFGFTGAESFVPLALVSIRGVAPGIAGLALTASTITWTAGAWLQARWFNRLAGRPLIGAGFGLVFLGVLLVVPVLSPAVPGPAALVIAVVAWAVTGLGMGLCYAPITLTVMNLAAPREQGAATASLQMSDVLGTALGAGVGGAIVALGASSGWDGALTLAGVFVLMAGVLLAGALMTGRVAPPASDSPGPPAAPLEFDEL